MKDGDVDYSKYTLREMEEALDGVNAEKYPKNHANLRAAYQKLTDQLPPAPAPAADLQAEQVPFDDDPPPAPKYDEHGRYLPNHIPASERLRLAGLSMLLLAYGSYGVWRNDFYVPARRGGMHLHDASAWSMFAAFGCACLGMLVLIADHYDRRDNELNYWRASRTVWGFGWTCFVLSLILWMLRDART
ncbi:hypothetical protein MNR01_06115 [Lysobacter sp. S4-A87]|uniref:hypothetical protein n=1 Tax=Lysobacter sp. S4-A87 TaxID=2925843 RepID=UPI001F52D838|nr:hypothetical protein [Lysobacter sp. S4-A87]UNK50580.1 hypothetical protein MNR01_06115 [Lysobacter sp. S4-A87]